MNRDIATYNILAKLASSETPNCSNNEACRVTEKYFQMALPPPVSDKAIEHDPNGL